MTAGTGVAALPGAVAQGVGGEAEVAQEHRETVPSYQVILSSSTFQKSFCDHCLQTQIA